MEFQATGKDSQEENHLCQYCEQVVSGCVQYSDIHPRYTHYSSALSLKQSSGICPLCNQLLRWVDDEKLLKCSAIEKDGGIFTSEVLIVHHLGDISHCVFLYNCTKWFLPYKLEGPKGNHTDESGGSAHFILAHEGGSSSFISKPIWGGVGNLSIENRAAVVHDWLQQCEAKHAECHISNVVSETGTLPARILIVDQSDGADIVRIITPAAVKGPFKYLALSHCWGKTNISVRTTKDNISNHEKGISILSLPKTFRHAVGISRLLGYEYIWIDSLCIIQDDISDWEREAARMSSIFQCADIVISAASARDSTQGCGIDNPLPPTSCFTLSGSSDGKSDTRAGGQCRQETRIMMRKNLGVLESLEHCPIQNRGWIFQETLLAQRVLYFVDGKMIWQCHHMLESEYGHIYRRSCPFPNKLSCGPLYDVKKEFRRGHSVQAWWCLLFDFFQREFTKPEDTLPSLAGLFNHLICQTNDRPVLGLWRNHLAFHLCWFPQTGCPLPSRVIGYPSWCWTSVPQTCRRTLAHACRDGHRDARFVIWHAPINHFDIQWEGRPFVSRLNHTALSFTQARLPKGSFDATISYSFDDCGSKMEVPDAVQLAPLIITKPQSIKSPGGASFRFHCLIIKHIDPGNGQRQFRRVGYAQFTSSKIETETAMESKEKSITDGIELGGIINMI